MAEHSPTPWRVVHGPARGLVILDAGGEAVAATLDPARQRSEADAALVVEAVNDYEWALGEIHKMTVEHDELFDEAVEIRKERDRLRDIVRELADEVNQLEEVDLFCNTDRAGRIEALFREALGEAQP